jgi:hypothetical protein
MRSTGHRSATVVTIVTLVFVPVAKTHHIVWRLFGSSTTTTSVDCAPGAPCPAQRRVFEKVYVPPAEPR